MSDVDALCVGVLLSRRPCAPLTIDAVSIKPAETVFGRFWVNWATAQLDESMKGTLKEIEVQASLDPSEESDWARNPNACGYRDRCALCSRMR